MKGPIGYELSPLAEEATRIIDGLKGAPSWVTTYYDNLNRLAQIIELMDVEIASRGIANQKSRDILKKLVHDTYELATVDIFSKALKEARAMFEEGKIN